MEKLFFENFKIFKEPVQIELAPITIFTGRNSSGKSTLIKGLLLLADFINSDFQLTLNLSEGNSIKHRLNKWENVKNWFTDNNTVSFGYSQYGLNFYFSFSAQPENSIALLDEFILEAPEINEVLVIKRRSDIILDLSVTQRFVNYIMGNRFEPSPDVSYNFHIANLKKELQSIREKKAKASQRELIGLIYEEDSTVKQMSMFQEQQKIYETNRSKSSIVYQPEINIEDDETFPSYKIQHLIRAALRSYMTDHNTKGGKFEMESKRQIDLIAFRFSEFLNNKSKFTIYHLSPGRVKQARLFYLYEGNSEFHELINWYGKHAIPAGEEHRFLLYWMKELGIGEDLTVRTIEGEAATVKIKLINSEKYVDLADLGYGVGQVLSILLAILKVQSDSEDPDLGSSHLRKNSLLMIEEAESNLHPLLQSKLAEMFFEANRIFKIQFLLETHSEYLIRKWQVMVAKDEMPSEDVLIYYLDGEMGDFKPRRITILPNGKLSAEFGKGFFDEATRNAMELFHYRDKK